MGATHSLLILGLGSIFCAVVLLTLLYWRPGDRRAVGHQESIVMYCAAGIRVPVERIVQQYVAESFGGQVQLQYGGSNTLLNQLQVSGIGDLYLAADDSYIDLAVQKGLVRESVPVAWIRPVVAVRKGNPQEIRSVQDLLREDVSVALGNPDAAAVGKKTQMLLRQSGHWAALEDHATVLTPTVNEIANSVKLGTVDAGIVWDATVAQYPSLEGVRLPELDAGTAQIEIGVLASSHRPTSALRFARYLAARDKGLKVFREAGFEPVEGDVWELRPTLNVYSGGVNRLAIEKTLDRFRLREGVDIDVIYNGCGILCSQMKAIRDGENEGVFPDAYFACDVSFMDQVSDLFVDTVNVSETDMVILTAPENPLGITGLHDLTEGPVKLGVANPDASALGALTRRLLQEMGIHDAVDANVSTRTPTADLLVNQVKAGGLDVAIVYRANASRVLDELVVVDIDHPLAKAVQPYAAARDSRHRHTVGRLVQSIRDSRQQFEEAGFHFLNLSPAP